MKTKLKKKPRCCKFFSLLQEDEPVTSKYFNTTESPDSESDFEDEIMVKKKRKSLETKQVKKGTMFPNEYFHPLLSGPSTEKRLC